MALHNLVLTTLLALLVVIGDAIWLFTDPRPFKQRLQRKISLTYPRVTLALVPQILFGILLPWPSTSVNMLFALVGSLLLLAGLGLAVWARAVMGHASAPPDTHNISRQDKLISTGPFSFTRNPIYVGVLLIVLGFAIAVRSYGLLLIIPLFISLQKSISREEKLLKNHFGEEYREYMKRTARFL